MRLRPESARTALDGIEIREAVLLMKNQGLSVWPSGRCRYAWLSGLAMGFCSLALIVCTIGTRSVSGSQNRVSTVVLGRIVDGTSNVPVAGARVMLGGSATIADATGRFVFFDPPAGPLELMSFKRGYGMGVYGKDWPGGSLELGTGALDGIGRGAGLRLEVQPGRSRKDVIVRMWRFGAVVGTIVDEAGQPVVGAQVQAWRVEHRAGHQIFNWQVPSIARTDDRGVYRLGELVAGKYVIVVPFVSLASSATTRIREFKDSASASWFSIMNQYGLFRTPAQEAVIVPGAEPWFLGQPVVGHDELGYQTTFFSDVSSADAAMQLNIEPGQNQIADISLKPVQTHKVCGIVVTPRRDKPIVVGLETGPPISMPVASIALGADGAFCFGAVPSGNYRVRFRETPPGSYSVYVPFDGSDSIGMATLVNSKDSVWDSTALFYADAPLTLNDRDINDLVIRPEPGARVEGQVRYDEMPRPLVFSGIRLELEHSDGFTEPVRMANDLLVDAQGHFRSIPLSPGSYLLRLRAAPEGWAIASAIYEGRDVASVPIQVGAGDVRGLTVTLTRAIGRIAGVVRSPSGAADSAAAVALLPVDRSRWENYGLRPADVRAVRTDETGRFRIDGIPAGDYLIIAAFNGVLKSWNDAALFQTLAAQAQRIRVDTRSISLDLTTTTIRLP